MSTAKSAYSVALGSEVVGGLGLTGKAAKTVGNIVTLPEFGASAYATTLQQDQANGISTENSIKHATAAGINEMLFEVVSLDHAWDILHRSGKTAAKEAIVSTLAQAGIEGTEEGFTDIANAIADNIINGDQSEYNRNVQNYVSMDIQNRKQKTWQVKILWARSHRMYLQVLFPVVSWVESQIRQMLSITISWGHISKLQQN